VDELPLERLRRGEPALHGYEFQLTLPEGPPRTILVNAGPLRDAAGNFAGAVLSGFDITERKAAERRLAEYTARLARFHAACSQCRRKAGGGARLRDELDQLLTAVRLNLRRCVALARRAQAGVRDGLAARTAIGEMRALSTRLRQRSRRLGLRLRCARISSAAACAELGSADIRLRSAGWTRHGDGASASCRRPRVTSCAMPGGRLAVLQVVDGALVLSVTTTERVRSGGRGCARPAGERGAVRNGGGRSSPAVGSEKTAPGRGTEVRVLFPLAEDAR
jgi:hypothetical protein